VARTTTKHAIFVKFASPYGSPMLEAVGTGTIYPGDLVEIKPGGTKLQVHSTASGASARFIAIENPTPNTSSTYAGSASIDIPYTSGDTVYYRMGQRGDEVNMRWATSVTAVKGVSWMTSDGSGQLTNCGTGVSVGTSNPVGLAWVAQTTSGITRGLVKIV